MPRRFWGVRVVRARALAPEEFHHGHDRDERGDGQAERDPGVDGADAEQIGDGFTARVEFVLLSFRHRNSFIRPAGDPEEEARGSLSVAGILGRIVQHEVRARARRACFPRLMIQPRKRPGCLVRRLSFPRYRSLREPYAPGNEILGR